MTAFKAVLTVTFGVLVATACASSAQQPISSVTSPSPIASSAPSASTNPSPVPSEPPVSSLPAFQCADQSGSGSGGAITSVSAVRVGAQQGFDRFVLQFGSAIPGYTVTRQSSSMFINSPRGDQVTLPGTAGVLVTVRPIDWTSYTGTKQLTPGFTYIKEARQVQNFEGVQQWGLGVQGTPCLRVFTLTSPMRLVVDVQAS